MVGWGPTVREIDHLSLLFSEVVHIAPLHDGLPPDSCFPYRSGNVRVRTVSPSGGNQPADKLRILALVPAYTRAMFEELSRADVVHVRCPANISLIGIVLLALTARPSLRWVKYAGNWRPGGKEALSYTLQRWLLNKGLHRGVVTVNGRWSAQPQHVKSFYNPCLTDEELTEASLSALNKQLAIPIRLLFVGRLEHEKGVARALHILALLEKYGLDARLDLIGDGPDRRDFEHLALELDIRNRVEFHGWLPRTSLDPLYRHAHMMLFPSSSSEGWPKVLSEAMAYGVVPVASNVSSIPQYLQRFRTGWALPPDDLQGFVETIIRYSAHPDAWRIESQHAVRAAPLFGYKNYLRAVCELLGIGETEELILKQGVVSGNSIMSGETGTA
jgi:glycosyltransferase involved in cell wall biosynthesis